jgi:hypothetical protein
MSGASDARSGWASPQKFTRGEVTLRMEILAAIINAIVSCFAMSGNNSF